MMRTGAAQNRRDDRSLERYWLAGKAHVRDLWGVFRGRSLAWRRAAAVRGLTHLKDRVQSELPHRFFDTA